jgi:hypothetical protein
LVTVSYAFVAKSVMHRPRRSPDPALGCRTTKGHTMPTEVAIGQKWSVWVAGRQQWLLAAVVDCAKGQATLAYDGRYGIASGSDQQKADERTMLAAPNLFRFIEGPL